MSDRYKQKLYNCAVVISDGSILGIVPKHIYQTIQNFMNYVILHLEKD